MREALQYSAPAPHGFVDEALTFDAHAGAASPVDAAWDAIRTGLRQDCGARTFDNWLKPITLGDVDFVTGSVVLNLPSRFMADWVRTHFGERLTLAWAALLPAIRDVRIAVGSGDAPVETRGIEPETVEVVATPASHGFDPRYRFETYVVGKANEGSVVRPLTVPVGRLRLRRTSVSSACAFCST